MDALKKQCFGNPLPEVTLTKDARAISGRPYFLTMSSIQAADHPFVKQIAAKTSTLMEYINTLPIVAKAKGALPKQRPEVPDKAWYALSVILIVWPVFLMFSSRSGDTATLPTDKAKTSSTATPILAASETTGPLPSLGAATPAEEKAEDESVSVKSDSARIPVLSGIGEGIEGLWQPIGNGIGGLFDNLKPGPTDAGAEVEAEAVKKDEQDPFSQAFTGIAEGFQSIGNLVSLPPKQPVAAEAVEANT